MTLPNQRPSIPAAPETIPATASAVDDNMPIAAGNRLPHADYNLHPLAVHGLDHYVEHNDDGERFHVV